ncbi:MAG: InlB B-repeat-containing protein [Treponema sp.]|nr:InlB B-repeat-containing protein [Treponema sp.]
MRYIKKSVRQLVLIFFSLFFLSCSFDSFIKNDGNEKSNLPGLTKLSFSVCKKEDKKTSQASSSRAMLLPEGHLEASSVYRFSLNGTRKDDEYSSNPAFEINKAIFSKDFEQTEDKSAAKLLSEFTAEIYEGEWVFNLTAWNSDGDGVLIGFCEVSKSITKDDVEISFTLGEPINGSGNCYIKINFPKGAADSVLYTTASLSNYSETQIPTQIDITNDVDTSYVVFDTAMASGNHFLKLEFYAYNSASESKLIARKTIHFKISPGFTTRGEITYDTINTLYSINYNFGKDSSGNTISAWNEEALAANGITEDFNDYMNVTLPDATFVKREGYDFEGWYLTEDCSGSSCTGWSYGEKKEDVTLYAKWTAKSYSLSYANYSAGLTDIDGNPLAKTFTGDQSTLPQVYTYDTALTIPNPSSEIDTATFEGWYTSADCNESSKLSDNLLNAESISSDTVLYAKWSFTELYVNPSAESNLDSGQDTSHPLKTIEEALLLSGGYGTNIYLLSTLEINENKTLDFDYENVYRAFTSGSLIEVTSPDDSEVNLTITGTPRFDGGYSTTSTDSIQADGPLLQVNSNCSVNVTGAYFQNNYSSNSGGAIVISGTGKVFLYTCYIQNNYAQSAGAVRVGSSSSDSPTFYMEGGSLFMNKAVDGDGGGIVVYAKKNTGYAMLDGASFIANTASENGNDVSITSGKYLYLNNCSFNQVTSKNIHSNGTLILSGSTAVGIIGFGSSSNPVNIVTQENTFKSPYDDSYLSPLSLKSGESSVASIILDSEPSESASLQVLKDASSSSVSLEGFNTLFSIENTAKEYSINTSGYVCFDSGTSGSSGNTSVNVQDPSLTEIDIGVFENTFISQSSGLNQLTFYISEDAQEVISEAYTKVLKCDFYSVESGEKLGETVTSSMLSDSEEIDGNTVYPVTFEIGTLKSEGPGEYKAVIYAVTSGSSINSSSSELTSLNSQVFTIWVVY